MTTQEFIYKKLTGATRKDSCSSVFAMTDGTGNVTIFSYSTHYPLVTIINGKAFINDRGYSNTTRKHISWAVRASIEIVGYDNVYLVPLQSGSLTPKNILEYAMEEDTRIIKLMASKHRTDTAVYRSLEMDHDNMVKVIQAVKELA